ncbi:MAG: hypothetical protein ACT4QC_22775 [Planctomycetaceae bacterium]
MRVRRLVAIGFVWLSAAAPACASEQHLDFVKGLRDRRYYDYALLYLDRLEQRADVAPDLKQIVPLERALTLLAAARAERNADEQTRQFDKARATLEQFLKASPNHRRAAEANVELAEVYIGKGRAAVQQARAQANAGRKGELQKQARDFFAEARKVLQPAHDRYKAEYEKHDKHIPQTDKDRYEAREQAYLNYIQLQLRLAELLFDESQAFDKGSKEQRGLLTDAADAFEQIHIRHRSQRAGLLARMWQGRSFQERDDVSTALGIYNELLEHGGDKPVAALKSLQDRVLGHKLACLNHDKRNHQDHQIVIQLANEWMKENRPLLASRDGLAIQWELARALEAAGKRDGIGDSEKNRLLQQALDVARSVNRFAGEYKDPSTGMVQRLLAALNRETVDPKDFAAAYSAVKPLIEEIRNRSQQIDGSRGAEREKLVADRKPVLREAARLLQLGLSLAGPKDDLKDVNRARYFLAFVYFSLGDHGYDAAVLGEFIARHYYESLPDVAADAAYLALVAYMQAFYGELRASDGQRSADNPDVQRMIGLCEFLAERFPESDETQDARLKLGQLYTQLGRPADAARWYLQVPESSGQYLEAQLSAGTAFWLKFREESIRPEAERLPKEALMELSQNARETLQSAITRYGSQLPREIEQVEPAKLESLARAKLTFASILNLSGEYKQARAILSDGPLSLLTIVTAPEHDEPERVARGGVRGREFASIAHQQMLRACVGLQDLDRARAEMKELEKIEGAGGGGAALTRIYIELGKELEKEVQRLAAARDPRLGDVLKSFDTFLDDIFRRTDGQDYQSLLWVAETYRALGDGLEQTDPTRSASYFSKAASALRAILDAEQRQSGYVPAGSVSGVQLRLAACLRRQKSFDEAESLVLRILKERPQALDAQTETARIYEDWAAASSPQAAQQKWGRAISGDQLSRKKDQEKFVWGWFGIAERLGTNLAQSFEPDAEQEVQYLDARFRVARCRFQQAQSVADGKKRGALLEAARTDVLATAVQTPELGGRETWARFNRLYRDVQQALVDSGIQKEAVVDLEHRDRRSPGAKAASRTIPKAPARQARGEQAQTGGEKPARPKSAESSTAGALAWALVLIVGVAGAAAAVWVAILRKPKRQPIFESAPVELASLGKPATPSGAQKSGRSRS